MTLDFDRFDALTFDCYGTLIDWETGLLAAMRRVLDAHGVTPADDELLERYARHEAALESGPYLRYRDVLARALAATATELGVTPSPDEILRTIKFEFRPRLRREITTPSYAWARLRVPSTTLTLTMTVSPGAKSGIVLPIRAISSCSSV